MSIKNIWNAMCGRNPLDETTSFEKTAASLEQFLSDKESYTLLCAGTMDEAKLQLSIEKLVDTLKQKGFEAGIGEGHQYIFLLGGNVLRNATCIELTSKVDGVVLVEEAYKSSFANIDEEINAFKELHTEVVGAILVHH